MHLFYRKFKLFFDALLKESRGGHFSSWNPWLCQGSLTVNNCDRMHLSFSAIRVKAQLCLTQTLSHSQAHVAGRPDYSGRHVLELSLQGSCFIWHTSSSSLQLLSLSWPCFTFSISNSLNMLVWSESKWAFGTCKPGIIVNFFSQALLGSCNKPLIHAYLFINTDLLICTLSIFHLLMFVLISCKLYIIYAFILQMQTLINYVINEAQHRGNKVCF